MNCHPLNNILYASALKSSHHEMSNRSTNRSKDKTTSNIYKDLGPFVPPPLQRAATSPIKIKVKGTPIRTISDATPRKAPVPPMPPAPPVPPMPTLPLMTMSLKSSISQRSLKMVDGEKREQRETFQFVQVPIESVGPASNDEINLLRKRIENLESTIEELQHVVRVRNSVTALKIESAMA
jgi:hypothetical protein